MSITLLLALAVTITAPSLAAPGSAPDRFQAVGVVRVEPPRPAPDVPVVVEGGEQAPLRSLRGRPVMLWFFATW